jgi:hypothetical protein
MAGPEFLRVVALRKRQIRPSEFLLRHGEVGLSLFARTESPGPLEIVEAVRAVGKQGELAVAVIAKTTIQELGLTLVKTMGGTRVVAVDALHHEARLPRWRQWLLRLRGVPAYEYFNEHFSQPLHGAARLLEGGSMP